jgi:hypothetical protein
MVNEEAVIDYFRTLSYNFLGEYITVHLQARNQNHNFRVTYVAQCVNNVLLWGEENYDSKCLEKLRIPFLWDLSSRLQVIGYRVTDLYRRSTEISAAPLQKPEHSH